MLRSWCPRLLDRFRKAPGTFSRDDVGNMYVVASGKGGIGKTWFSITLTHLMAKQGRRVLLFDGDLGMANVDIQLGITPEKDLVNVIEGKCHLAEAITTYETLDGTSFKILPGRSGSGVLGNMPSQRLMNLREKLKVMAGAYNDMIVDLGAGADNIVRILTGLPATIFILTTDDPTALTDAYALIKMLVIQKADVSLQVVVNLAESQSTGMATYQTLTKACKQFLGVTPGLAGIIRRDKDVQETVRRQQPLAQNYPQSLALQDMVALVETIKKTTMKSTTS